MQWIPNCGTCTTSGTRRLSRWCTNRLTFSRQIIFTAIIFIDRVLLINSWIFVKPTSLVNFGNGHKNSDRHFVNVETVSKLLIEWYLAHWLCLEQGGMCWQYGTHKWYVIRKILGTTETGIRSDTDIILKNRMGLDSENPLFDHLCSPVVSNLFLRWPTCRFQQNVVAHHHRTIKKSTLSLHLSTNMSKQNEDLTIIHRILFNFSISNTSTGRLRDKHQSDFYSCVNVWCFRPDSILGYVVERAHLR